MNSGFDPGAVAVENGNYFGFPYSQDEAEILVLPAPWDVTTSYGSGTSAGPQAILQASTQLDFTSPFRDKAWETKIGTLKPRENWALWNKMLRPKVEKILRQLEAGERADPSLVLEINGTSQLFHQELYEETKKYLAAGKKMVTLGGDHSVSFGPILAHCAAFPGLSVLHIDAHADLRTAYCGFPHSHASIMDLVKDMPIKTLVQVGLRDVSPQEIQTTRTHPRIHAFFDFEMRRGSASGISWKSQCQKFLEPLGKEVYLSLDVDGLDPKFCPHTGTPVPGGLEMWELMILLEEVEKSGRIFVGADLVEVAPDPEGKAQWDANVGARLLFHISQLLCRPHS